MAGDYAVANNLAKMRTVARDDARLNASHKVFRGKNMFSRLGRAAKVLIDESTNISRALLAKLGGTPVDFRELPGWQSQRKDVCHTMLYDISPPNAQAEDDQVITVTRLAVRGKQ